MDFLYNDGGRAEAGYKGSTGDCVCRAIAIACEMPYQEAYDLINKFGAKERNYKQRTSKSGARTGVWKSTEKKVIRQLGWNWTPTMHIGSGCKVHLKADELPSGRIICQTSKHLVAVVDGVIQDTYDCSRNETRCVYGYWSK